VFIELARTRGRDGGAMKLGANGKAIVSHHLPVKFLVRKVAFESTAGFLKDRTV